MGSPSGLLVSLKEIGLLSSEGRGGGGQTMKELLRWEAGVGGWGIC